VARALVIVLGVLLLAGCGGEEVVQPTGPVEGTLPKQEAANPAEGKKVFESNGCGSCHTLKAAAATGQIGPDLDEALKSKDLAFIEQSISEPNAEIASGYQPNVMPQTYGTQLTSQQLNDLAAFLKTSTQ
jgi:mono/diheme cytochrome c family protein